MNYCIKNELLFCLAFGNAAVAEVKKLQSLCFFPSAVTIATWLYCISCTTFGFLNLHINNLLRRMLIWSWAQVILGLIV